MSLHNNITNSLNFLKSKNISYGLVYKNNKDKYSVLASDTNGEIQKYNDLKVARQLTYVCCIDLNGDIETQLTNNNL
jgi:hypothetical protein